MTNPGISPALAPYSAMQDRMQIQKPEGSVNTRMGDNVPGGVSQKKENLLSWNQG